MSEENIKGNFRKAITNLINELNRKAYGEGDKEIKEIIEKWDKDRGTDWFTQTRKDVKKFM